MDGVAFGPVEPGADAEAGALLPVALVPGAAVVVPLALVVDALVMALPLSQHSCPLLHCGLSTATPEHLPASTHTPCADALYSQPVPPPLLVLVGDGLGTGLMAALI